MAKYWMNDIPYQVHKASFYRFNRVTKSCKFNITMKWLENYDPKCEFKFGYLWPGPLTFEWQTFINGERMQSYSWTPL